MTDVQRGERRLVSVLVTDVVDSTAIGELLGPERSKFLFDEIAVLIEAEVQRFEGTVAQHTGDGVLALFGAPVAHEDDSLRAVRAACALQKALTAYAQDVKEAYGVELGARAAVNTGPVVIPDGDAPFDVAYNALGDTVNVAARLQGLTRPGGVAIGPVTARQIEDRFVLEPLGDLMLKGKSEPVSAFLVVGEARAASPRFGSALVGRAAELAALEGVFEDLKAGRGGIVSISGEPGIGKSRLIGELRAEHGEDVRFLEGSGVSYAETIPYWPVREAVRDWLGLGATEVETRTRLELKTRLEATLGDGAEAAQPFLAMLLGVSPGREGQARLRDLSQDSVQRQTLEAVHDLLVALAREQAVCLVLDDLHWADDATLELVGELLEATDEEAVLIVLVYRSEREHGAWRLGERARQRFPHRHTELALRALEAAASRSLAVGAAGGALPGAVAELLTERSGGNPFFLEQALRDLVERGVLRRENGGFALEEGVEIAVPLLVQEALQARLGRLPADCLELVRVAAVAGKTFAVPLLEKMAPRLSLSPLLADLQRLDLIVEQRRRPVAEYRFRHGLVREVAYASLLEARRRDLHRSAGEALEALHADTPQEVYGLLAYHFAAADAPHHAARYLVAAADAARALDANEEAIRFYERAVPFLDRVGDEQGARAALLKLGLTHHLAFDFARSNEAYAAAFARAVEPPSARGAGEQLTTAISGPRISRLNIVPGHSYEDLNGFITLQLFRGLLQVDEQLNVIPDIASAFEVSADGKRYRFHIRPDARWSDGHPVTAGDFAYTWTRMREDRVASAHLLEILERFEAVDDRTLEVELEEPRSWALYLFGSVPFFPWPRHVVEPIGKEWPLAPTIVGNGPYMLAEFDDEHALLRASPNWHGHRGNVEEARLEFSRWDEIRRRWRAGELDFAFGWQGEQDETTRIFRAKGIGVVYFVFGATRPPLDDPRVRRALAHALDRDALRHTFLGDDPDQGSTGGGLIPPPLPAHSHDIALPYHPTRARELLAEAGFADGQGLRTLRLLVNAQWGPSLPHDAIEQWAAVGISVELDRFTADAFDDAVEQGRADLWWNGWTADYPDPEGMFTLLPATPTLHRDEILLELLAAARSSEDRDERNRLYREADQRLVQELVSIIPLFHGNGAVVTRPWVEGVRLGPMRLPQLEELTVRRDRSS